ncbi:enoyl-CoA hydratase-related protein [Candidatus Uabimicrobium sp. HlEnr_7]|uniref:enoyl-CoA hydratase-related protein n=1 Tax=Candidatus Uabimicrobium helgolandensis TaxID=3095367 RepID=UPI003556A640
MEYQNLTCEIQENIAIITLQRPKALNALNQAILTELNHVFSEHLSREIRCVVLTGSEKAFVAGADIKEMDSMTPIQSRYFARSGQLIFQTIENFHAPVIAAVNGYALGGGCELALACDIRLASQKAKFGQPEVNLGIIPGFGGTQRLTRTVGPGKARELIYTGNTINAEEAHRIGLANAVHAPEELMPETMKMAETIAAKAPLAVSLCKKAINMGTNMDISRAIEFEADLFAESFATNDRKEGIEAFVQKRKANFVGK